jgi:hypothetical protein
VANGYYPGPCATTAAQAQAAGKYIQSHVSGGGWSLTKALRAEAQYVTVVAAGSGTALCIAATEGLCALAVPEFGGLTNDAIYAEGSGPHTAEGYSTAFATGALGGTATLICVALCETVGVVAIVAGGLVNGLAGSGEGVVNYASEADCHTISGYASAALSGFGEGFIPWEKIVKAVNPN